jgi:hypothetical protein
MSSSNVNVEDLIKSFRVGYDKAGLTIYVIPRENVTSITRDAGYAFNNEDIQLYGTRVILHLPCNGIIYGRYLTHINNELKGLFVVITENNCDISISWYEEGIDVKTHVKSNEALIIIVRLMRIKPHRIKPSSYALRIMRALGLSGRLLYSDTNNEIQVFGIEGGLIPSFQGNCMSEFIIKQWKLIFDECGFIVKVISDNDNILLIGGVNTMVIKQYYPSLDKWYELSRVTGFRNYLVVLEG